MRRMRNHSCGRWKHPATHQYMQTILIATQCAETCQSWLLSVNKAALKIV